MTGFAMIDSTQSSQLRVAIIGAGMSGILAAIKLREDGWQHVVIYEKAARIGGTWRDNSYPGLACARVHLLIRTERGMEPAYGTRPGDSGLFRAHGAAA